MVLTVELEREADGRWIADVRELLRGSWSMVPRATRLARVEALALRVVADRVEHGELPPHSLSVSFTATAA